MKKIFFLATICGLFFACNTKNIEEKHEIKVKRMGITNKYLNEIGLPPLKLWKKEKDLRELSALEIKQYLEYMERNGGKKKEW